MKIDKNDYLILRSGDSSKNLIVQAFAIDPKSGEYLGVIDDKGRAQKETQETLRFSMEDVVANLGPTPELGNAYKVKVEPFETSFHMKPWGDVFIFRKISEGELKVLRRGLQEVGEWIVKNKLDQFLPLEIHVRPSKGKYAGFYHSPRGADAVPIITLQPKVMENMRYVLMHEYGHHIWFNMFPPSLKARWIQIYHDSINLSPVKDEKIASLLNDFRQTNERDLRAFRSELEDDEVALFDEIMGYIYNYHMLSQKHLQLLINEGYSLEPYWPSNALELQDMRVLVSEYAQKSPEELWPEALAFCLSNLPVPETLKTEVQLALRIARGESVALPKLKSVGAV